MKLLLDTHSFLWFTSNDSKLSAVAYAAIRHINNEVFISIATAWEIAIKVSIGKFDLRQPVDVFINEQLERTEIELLNISVAHVAEVSRLPLHHRDPFDRLLIAQAKVEGLALVSVDSKFDAYGIARIW
jgi:PIN domain nuclease of toxin-antitoxin system